MIQRFLPHVSIHKASRKLAWPTAIRQRPLCCARQGVECKNVQHKTKMPSLSIRSHGMVNPGSMACIKASNSASLGREFLTAWRMCLGSLVALRLVRKSSKIGRLSRDRPLSSTSRFKKPCQFHECRLLRGRKFEGAAGHVALDAREGVIRELNAGSAKFSRGGWIFACK